jgi:hypothetical protein
MKQYRFEGFPGHPALKNFVLGYQPSNDRLNLATATTSPTISQPPAAGTTAAVTQ